MTGFHSRSNRPSSDNNKDGCSEIIPPPIATGDFSEKLEIQPTCGKINDPPPGLPQPQSLNNHEKPPIGNLAWNPDSRHAYDQLAIHDPLLHRLLVQKHIHDQSSSNNCRVVPVDSQSHRHQQQEEEEEEEVVMVVDEEAMLEQQRNNVYCEGASTEGPRYAHFIMSIPDDGNPSRIIPLSPINMLKLYSNNVYHQPHMPPPVIEENLLTSNADCGGRENRANIEMGNAIRVPVTPRGTAPAYLIPELAMAHQQLPFGPRYFENPHENLVAPDHSLLPNQYEATSSRFLVPPAGRQQQLPFSSGNPNLAPVSRGIGGVSGPAFLQHQYQHFSQHNFDNWRNFPAQLPHGRDSRQPGTRLKPMPPR